MSFTSIDKMIEEACANSAKSVLPFKKGTLVTRYVIQADLFLKQLNSTASVFFSRTYILTKRKTTKKDNRGGFLAKNSVAAFGKAVKFVTGFPNANEVFCLTDSTGC